MKLSHDDFFTKWYDYFAAFAGRKLSNYSGRFISPKDPEALDYVHDAYMKSMKLNKDLVSPFGRFEGTETNRKTWFCVLIDNCMKDKFKKASNRMEMLLDFNPPIGKDNENLPLVAKLEAPASTRSDRNTDILEMLKALRPHLTDPFFKVLILRSASLTYHEIAGVLGVPIGTVSSRIHTVRTKAINLDELDLETL